jgi:uncharacterized protein (TIGR03067 family)
MSRFALLALLALPLAAAPVPKGMKAKRTDAELIIGKWVTESSVNGPTVYDEKGNVWVFAPPGEKSVEFKRNGDLYSREYSFPDLATNHFDVMCNGHPYIGIYELDGDSLKLAFAEKTRPTTFDRTAGVFVLTFTRKAEEK